MRHRSIVGALGSCAHASCALLAIGGSALSEEARAFEKPDVERSSSGGAPTLVQMGGPLAFSEKPLSFELPQVGAVDISTAVTGVAQWQTHRVDGDHAAWADFANAHVIIQKPEGAFQFLLHAGVYSFASLGVPYLRAGKTTAEFYGPLPEAYVKLAPDERLSVLIGKIPSLGGAENTFSFQNANIQRGLLWNQTSSVSRGVQINYATGPLAFGLAWTDGFYSNRFTWISGTASWTIDDANSLTIVGAANTKATSVSTIAAPITQNNSQIYNIVYTYKAGAWTITPYAQYTRVPVMPWLGVAYDSATWGGALLATYDFAAGARIGGIDLSGFSIPFRAEYIAARGTERDDAPNLLYGPASRAWSLTITPTWRFGPLFARAEFSYVRAGHVAVGSAFGVDGDKKNQARFLIESGVLF